MFEPNALILLQKVADIIGNVANPISDFERRVCKNAMQIAMREIKKEPEIISQLLPQLQQLLSTNDNDFDKLYDDLAIKIKNGEIDETTNGLMAFLHKDAIARLGVDQPNYKHEWSVS